jgi:hypothetical protein
MKMSIVTKRLLNVAILFAVIATVTQSTMAVPTGLPNGTVPDAGSTSLLMGLACGGLAALRRLCR